MADHEPISVLMGRVLADLPAISKNSAAPASMGGYKFRGIEDITAALKPVMAKHGVFCLPNIVRRIESERPTRQGGVMYCVDLKIEFMFWGPASDVLSCTVWGQGTDSGDKATQKAITSAFKSMLTVAFLISDSENDAERHEQPETTVRQAQRPPAEAQAAPAALTPAQLDELARKDGWSDFEQYDKISKRVLPGLRELAARDEISADTAKALWASINNRAPKTLDDFNLFMANVEAAKTLYKQVKAATEGFGALPEPAPVPQPTATPEVQPTPAGTGG